MSDGPAPTHSPAFLEGGGELGALMRARDWSASPLGAPEGWPQPLRTLVGILLAADQPMFVAWGPGRALLYNDAYAEILVSKHPAALGRDLLEVWGEIRADLLPIVERAYAGRPVHMEDIEFVMHRRGHPEETHFAFSYTPVRDEAGKVAGFLCACVEITERIHAQRRDVVERQRFEQMFRQAPSFMAMLRGPEHHVELANPAYMKLIGRRDALGKTVAEALPDAVEQGYLDLLDRVYASGEAIVLNGAKYAVQASPGGAVDERYVDFVYQPLTDAEGRVTGVFVEGADVTDRVIAEAELRESEERSRRIAEGVKDHAIFTTDAAGVVADWAAGAEAIFGWTAGEILGRSGDLLFTPEDRAAGVPARELAEAREKGCANDERWHVRRDGSRFFANGLVRPLHDADGEVSGFIKIARDETERRAAEAALARRSEQLQALAEAALVVAHAPTLEATLDEIMKAARRIIGAHQGVVSLTRGPDWSQAINAVALTDKYALWREYATMPDGGGIYAWLCEENRPARMTQTELEAHPRWRAFGPHANEHPPMRGWLAAPLSGRDGRNLGLIQLSDKEDGSEFDEADEAMLVQLAQLASAAVEQVQTEDALRASEARVRALTDNLPSGMVYQIATGPDGGERRFLYVSQSHEKLTGVPASAVLADPSVPYRLILPEHREELAAAESAAIRDVRPFDVEARIRRTDGEVRWTRIISAPRRQADGSLVWDGIQIDITEQKEAEVALRELNETLEVRVARALAEQAQVEEQLRQAQKMEAVGQLTGGLAHDFNNLLAGISGSLELMSARLSQGRVEDVERYMTAAQGAARRAAALTHRLLAFSRRQTLNPKPTDVNALVRSLEELIRRTVGPSIAVEVVGSSGLWPALVDAPQLENALLNLCINARDAMPAGGRITVETANKWIDARAAREHDMEPGQYLSLCVSDTGTGMPPEVVAKAFDPFFTTKPIGQGTGLGLSMTYGFAKQSGGQVRIYSEVGQGTTVCIYLPRRRGEAEGAEAHEGASTEAVRAPRVRQSKTVLVVDDEPLIRMLVADVLDELGFTTIEAGDSVAGLKVLQSQERIDLLVTDVGLPGGMNGRQLADAARVTRPGLKVLLITGYAENAVLGQGQLPSGMQVLTKPFEVEALAARIQEIIEERP